MYQSIVYSKIWAYRIAMESFVNDVTQVGEGPKMFRFLKNDANAKLLICNEHLKYFFNQIS